MEDLIRKFGNVTIDVREVSCIGELYGFSGPSVGVDIYLKHCGKVSVVFDNEEVAKKEINWLTIFWKQSTP